MTKYVAVDLETTGLNPHSHDIIEVGIVSDGGSITFSLPFDPDYADPKALEINKALTRQLPPEYTGEQALITMAEWLDDAHLVGKNPSFDVSFLTVFFEAFNTSIPWHHRLVDVGSLAWGWHQCDALPNGAKTPILEPPKTQEVAEFMGIPLPEDQQHAALADAEWAWRVFRTIVPA